MQKSSPVTDPEVVAAVTSLDELFTLTEDVVVGHPDWSKGILVGPLRGVILISIGAWGCIKTSLMSACKKEKKSLRMIRDFILGLFKRGCGGGGASPLLFSGN